MTTNTPRAARKKLLLLEGALHRIELMQARQSLRGAAADSVISRGLPGMLAFLLRHKAGAVLASVLPLLVGGSRLSRIVRRATLLLGAGAAVLNLFSRRQDVNPDAEPLASASAAADDKTAAEKNPGQSRD